jgi:putative hydrolase of the HAD superfamily
MNKPCNITTLFADIGGVLLTNGWDRHMRRAAADKFDLDYDEMNDRHHMTFDTYEEGKLSLDEYLDRVVFHQSRPFSRPDFKNFMFSRSQPLPKMLDLLKAIKVQHGLKVAAVSNEGRELTIHRVKTFQLKTLIDFFISSCFVHFRKPDHDMYRIALDIAQVEPENVLYIDDRPMFVQVAADLGIRGIAHESYESTRDALAEFGLTVGQP